MIKVASVSNGDFMRLEIIWQINNFNVAVASHTYMFSIGDYLSSRSWAARVACPTMVKVLIVPFSHWAAAVYD